MANLPTSIKNLNTLLGEQLTEGGGGSSDFSTATMTIVNGRVDTKLSVPCILDNEEFNMRGSATMSIFDRSSCQVILYKGKAYVITSQADVESTGGNIEYDADIQMYVVTGDCTITYTIIS